MNFKQIIREFERHGVLLLSDSKLLSVSGLVAGKPVRGSWWWHPAGHTIFRMAGELADHPGCVVTKLVFGKVTFVHRNDPARPDPSPAVCGSKASWVKGVTAPLRCVPA
jgi:hypothetical protein